MCDEVNDELAMLIIDPEQMMIDWEEYEREQEEQCKSVYQIRLHSSWPRWNVVRCTKRNGHKSFHLADGIVWATIQERRRLR
jgi:hypothetical protein